MKFMKFITVIALAMAAVVSMATEMQIVPASELKTCPNALKHSEKLIKQVNFTADDELFAAYEMTDGAICLHYTGNKPARIYSWSAPKDGTMKDGTELMILNIPGRSKAKVKMYMGGKFTHFARNFLPSTHRLNKRSFAS